VSDDLNRSAPDPAAPQDERGHGHSARFDGWASRHPNAPLCLRLLISRFSPGERDLKRAFLYLGLGILSISLLLSIVVELPQVPFNVRELFLGKSLILSLPAFAAFLIWTAAAPNLIARITIICPMLHLAQPLSFLLIALPSWWLLSFSVTSESLFDILGQPVLDWPGDREMTVRYLALSAPFLLSLYYWNLLLEGSAWLNRQFGVGQMLAALIIGLPLLWLSKYIVVDQAATENILALTAQGPSWQVGGFLALTIAVISLNGVLLAWIWLWRRSHQIAALMITPVLLLTSWWLLNQGLAPEAVPFLLGPDYAFEASPLELFARWSLLYIAVIVLIAFAHLIPFRLRGSGASQREALTAGTFPHTRRGGARPQG